MPKAILVLEDGTTIEGRGVGLRKEVFGEIVFNTSMTGYEETFTDPSYAGQILLMTYPLIGNYGFHKRHYESGKAQIRGLVLKEPYFFSYRGMRLEKFLREEKIPCVYGIDTRALTLKIRKYGTMRALLINSNQRFDVRMIMNKLKKTPHPDTENLVGMVSCKKIIVYKNHNRRKVVLIDCGVKKSILDHLRKHATVIQVPYDTDIKIIDKFKPSGIVISNGPGNPGHPEIIETTIKTVRNLLGKYPVLGICLGHQLLSIALGFKTYKMKFGHRGSNHAVKNLITNKIYITSQNHGYAIGDTKIKDVEINWINVNDGTIEGIMHKKLPVFSTQFHPEARPGPYDTGFLFEKFLELISAQA